MSGGDTARSFMAGGIIGTTCARADLRGPPVQSAPSLGASITRPSAVCHNQITIVGMTQCAIAKSYALTAGQGFE